MKILKNLVVNILISAILLYLFNYFWLWINIQLPSWKTEIFYQVWMYLILWLIFWIFNSPIKRILKTLSCPVNFLTLWLLSIAINVLIFYLFAYFTNNFFDGELIIRLWKIRQTLILSFIMAIGTTILKKIL